MKLSVFKKLIREVIREELDYKFSRLEKKLNEVLDNSNSSNMNKARSKTIKATGTKKMLKTRVGNVSSPKTNSNVLNQLLKETAQSEDWKTVEGKSEVVQSVHDNTEQLPDHLANALNKDYSKVMEKVEEKGNFKNGI